MSVANRHVSEGAVQTLPFKHLSGYGASGNASDGIAQCVAFMSLSGGGSQPAIRRGDSNATAARRQWRASGNGLQ
ncbi:protein of unknown function [Pararobbsia alpina]